MEFQKFKFAPSTENRMLKLSTIVVLIVLAARPGFGSKILAYFPTPAPSHHFFFQPVLNALGKRGHQIDYYTPVPMRIPHPNVTIVKLDLSMNSSLVEDEIQLYHNWKLPIVQQMKNMWKVSLDLEKDVCQTNEVQKLISSKNDYDLLIHEGMFWLESSNIFKHKFNVPSVALLAVGDFAEVAEFAGLEMIPSYMVNGFSAMTDRMNFFERLQNTFTIAGVLFSTYQHLRSVQEIVDRCHSYPGWESRPPLTRLVSDQALILVNNHPSVGFSFPKPPHYKEIGGAVILPRKPLPRDLRKFIEEAKDGIVYFSLGTLFDFEKALPQLKDVLTRVFSSRRERFLWKWNGQPFKDAPSNVLLSKWFPQQDILAHKNIRLFITHGGLESYFEAVYFGVPLISIPSFGDQDKNSLATAQHGYGVRLSLDNITESSLNWALDETLYQRRYKERAVKGSEVLRDRIMDPVDEGVYWIEYVLRHGSILQPEGARLSFIQLHSLDVFAFLIMVLIIISYLIILFLSSLRTLITQRKKSEVIKKKRK